MWYDNQVHSLWITAYYQDSTVRRCRIMTLCGSRNVSFGSLFMTLLYTTHTVSTIRPLATSSMRTIITSLMAMLMSVWTQTTSREGRCLSVRIMMSDDGTVLATLSPAVVSECRSVVAVLHDDIAATRVVSSGDVDAAGRVEEKVTWAWVSRWRLTAGGGTGHTPSQRTAPSQSNAADTQDTIGHDNDDGIHRRVAVVEATGRLWWVSQCSLHSTLCSYFVVSCSLFVFY